jgi:bacterioferritin (cytochrome b1)
MKKILGLLLVASGLFSAMIMAQNADPSIECFVSLQDKPNLQILKSKVALSDVRNQTLEMLSNNLRPSNADKSALVAWDAYVSECNKNGESFHKSHYAPKINALSEEYFTNLKGLLSDLYSGKITYGTFAKSRATLYTTLIARIAEASDQIKAQNAEAQRRIDEFTNASAQQQAQQQAQDQAQRRAIGAQMILNNKPYQAQFIPMTPNLQSPIQNPSMNCNPNGSGGFRCQ